MKRVLAQVRKELRQILRDRLALALALVLPSIMVTLLGTAISLDVRDLPIVAQDLDQTPMSRRFLDAFRASLSFRIVPLAPSEQPEEALRANRARGALIIPEHFERDLRRGRAPSVQLLVDATDSNTATLVSGKAAAVTAAFNDSLSPPAGGGAIRESTRLWFNPGRESRKFYGPGAFVLALALFPPLLAAIGMAREGEQKTILQVYVSSISAQEFLLGKVLAGVAVGAAEWLLLFGLTVSLFGVRLVGDPGALVVASILFLFCGVSFGALVGASIPSQAAAVQVLALVGFMLSLLLSGLIFPIENIPPALRWISGLVQARYYIDVVRDSLLRGGGWRASWPRVLAIAAIGAVYYILAWWRMRKMQLES